MEGRYIKIRGINYYIGFEGNGYPVLLLHGFTGSHRIWKNFVRFNQGSYRFIIPDLLGHGQSDCPSDEHRYSMEETLLDLEGLLDHLNIETCFCVGYSMGGRIALSFSLAYGARVKGLILESSSPGLYSLEERQERVKRDNALAERIRSIGIRAFAEEWAHIPLFSTQAKLPVDVLQTEQQIRMQNREDGLAQSLRGIGTGSQPSNWEKLKDLRIPTLLVTGILDKKFTNIALQMMQQLKTAHHLQIKDAGHTVHLEQPQEFAQSVYNFFSAFE